MRPLFLFLLTLTLASGQTNTNIPVINFSGSTPATNAPPVPDAAQLKAIQNAHMLRDASEMLRDGKQDDALATLNTVLQSDPQSIAGYVLRGQLYSQKKMWDKAADDFQSAHLIDPKNNIVNFDVAETKFVQKNYDAARAGFAEIQTDPTSEIGDIAAYKIFLCDLFGGHADVAAKEFDAFNQTGSRASYYYANVAWSAFHHNTEDARSWLTSASHIYSAQKNGLYSKSLFDLGYLPLPPPAPH
jgi:Tfp pilus assembly protein PilF